MTKIYNMKTIFSFFLIITLTYTESQIPKTNTTITSYKTNSTQIKKEELVAEGGVKKNVLPAQQMKGREGYTRVAMKTTPKSVITPVIELPHSSELLDTITNLTKNGDHKTIGRKGVGDEKTNATVKPKKPTITVSKDEWFAPSHFELAKSNTTSSKLLPQVPNVDILNNNQDNTQKYIVPIVVVILSVPFVAILISIVYKRGAEWWKYRHYRRMDFLINGIYDN